LLIKVKETASTSKNISMKAFNQAFWKTKKKLLEQPS
jgi:hypothetical protein